MKIYILPVDDEFQPDHQNFVSSPQQEYGVEQDFLWWLQKQPDLLAATPKEAMKHLDRFCTTNGHVFWADNISLLKTLSDSSKLRLTGHQQVTDFYLAALAEHNGGKLATFDGSLAKCLAGTELDQNIEVIT